jgi:hypothetical protein
MVGQRIGGSIMAKKVSLLLVVISVLLAAYVFRRPSTPSPVRGGAVRQRAAAVVPVPVPAPAPQAVEVPSSPAAEVSQPQPVSPAVATEAGPAEQEELSSDTAPKVGGIIADTGNRFRALVGDALVSEGSMVQGYRVRKVLADGVEFEKDGQIWVQKLN